MVVHPKHRNVIYIYARDTLHSYWVTKDGGETYRHSFNHDTAIYLRLHPTLPNVAAATSWRNFCYRYCTNSTNSWHPNLLLTFDYGETWTLVAEYAGSALWSLASHQTLTADASVAPLGLTFVEDPLKTGGWRQCQGFGSCDLLRIDLSPTGTDFAKLAVLLHETVTITEVEWSGSARLDEYVPDVFVAVTMDRQRNNTRLMM